jgi:hypothetical protein
MKTALIFGSSGLIGSQFVKILIGGKLLKIKLM